MYHIPIDQIAKELGCTYQGPTDVYVQRVVFDSREVAQGDLFVAIRGQRVDGNRFLEQAIEAGAAAVVCDAAHAFSSERVGCVTAEDGQAFIQELG